MMTICIKKHLSIIWNSIHEKVKQRKAETELKKSVAYIKKACTSCLFNMSIGFWLCLFILKLYSQQKIKKHS